MVFSDHTIVTFIYSLLVHQVLDRVLSDPALVYNILITRLWYKLSVYKNTTRGTIFTIYFTLFIANFLWIKVFISPLFFTIFKILHIVMIGGGGAMW